MLSLMQRGAEQRSLCDWHLFFALIYRGRCLSTRSPGPASPVETSHPRELYYTRFFVPGRSICRAAFAANGVFLIGKRFALILYSLRTGLICRVILW